MSDWIQEYTKWAVRRSPLTPIHFHENIALTVLAGTVAGRCFVQLPHEQLFPNLYTLIVARTSVFAKTTAFNLARQLTQDVIPEKMFSSISTPESLFGHLAGEMPSNFEKLSDVEKKKLKESAKWGARRLFMLDEAGMFFNTLSRDYNTDLPDNFMKLYDAGSGERLEHTTVSRGLQIIENYAMSILFATTPYSIKVLLTQRSFWMKGFWNRWNFVSAKELTQWQESQYLPMPIMVAKTLNCINTGWMKQYEIKPFSIPIETNVVKEYMQATKQLREETIASDDERFDGVMSRLPAKHMKAAILFSILDQPEQKPKVKLAHWEQAAPLVNGWYSDAKQALELSQTSDKIDNEEKVISYIRANMPNGIRSRDLQRQVHLAMDDLMRILNPLKEMGVVGTKADGKTNAWIIGKEETTLKVETE